MAERASTRSASAIGFEARLQRIGDRTILRLPAEASAELPSRGQVAAEAVMNGHAFTTVLEPDGMKGHWLTVDAALRQTLGLDDGDTVSAEVEPTKQWPEPDIPADLQAGLAEAPDISGLWAGITPMARWEWVRWVQATKNPQTRSRRVEVSVSKLRSGKRRPCCFDLSSCTDPELSKNGKLVDGE